METVLTEVTTGDNRVIVIKDFGDRALFSVCSNNSVDRFRLSPEIAEHIIEALQGYLDRSNGPPELFPGTKDALKKLSIRGDSSDG